MYEPEPPSLLEDYGSRLRPLLAAVGRPTPAAAVEDLPDERVRQLLSSSPFVRAFLDDFGHARRTRWDLAGFIPIRLPPVSEICEEYLGTEYGDGMFRRRLFPLTIDGGGHIYQVSLKTGDVYHMDVYWNDEDSDELMHFEHAVMQRWPSLAAFCDALANDGPREA